MGDGRAPEFKLAHPSPDKHGEASSSGAHSCAEVFLSRGKCIFPSPRGGLEASVVEGVLLASPLIRMALGIWVQGEGMSMR